MDAPIETRTPAPAARSGESLLERYRSVRAATLRLAEPLSAEDCQAQSMAEASPVKWQLGHTSWFFETFVLAALPAHRPFHPGYGFLFNSYYETVGDRVARARRGLMTRPGLEEVRRYRRHVDGRMEALLAAGADERTASVVNLGLHHEEQHQELILTDLKHLFSLNPLRPAYREAPPARGVAQPLRFLRHPGGLERIGHQGKGFAFDNEGPAHQVFLQPFELASRPATQGEYLEFIADGGYERPELWLSEGWEAVQREGWRAPMHWIPREGGWSVFTLAGERELDPAEPVTHVSYYEAEAFAAWSGARLPREAEWEVAARALAVEGNFVESGALHPRPSPPAPAERPSAMFGDVWEWTLSPYAPYPGFRPAAGALGEYNGKFMVNQMVLRGGSCASPRGHLRASYRNFFRAGARWQFSGIRLARDS